MYHVRYTSALFCRFVTYVRGARTKESNFMVDVPSRTQHITYLVDFLLKLSKKQGVLLGDRG